MTAHLPSPHDWWLGWMQARGRPELTPTAPRQMQITERAPKAEIISAACELADSQAQQIEALQQQQVILLALVGVLATLLVL